MLIQQEIIKCPECWRELYPTKDIIMSLCPCGEMNEFDIEYIQKRILNGDKQGSFDTTVVGDFSDKGICHSGFWKIV